ncbi:PAC2 family protein [Chloroflexota bacterium]
MSNSLLVLEKDVIKPEKPTFMIAGFNQFANVGNVSSGIPEYLIEKLHARKVVNIRKGDFYIFQVPGSPFNLRPRVDYVEGCEKYYLEEPINDFYYAEISEKGLIIFNGTEPNQREDVYVHTLLDGAEEMRVKRIIVPASIGGEVPFDKERLVNCHYNLKQMQEELNNYAFTFPTYNINATIGMVINHFSKERGIESVRMRAFTPSYQFSVMIQDDKRAMYDILRRIRYMFGISLDLSDLEKESEQQISDYSDALNKLFTDRPDLKPQIAAYMEQIRERYEELKFEEPVKIPDVFMKEFDNHL